MRYDYERELIDTFLAKVRREARYRAACNPVDLSQYDDEKNDPRVSTARIEGWHRQHGAECPVPSGVWYLCGSSKLSTVLHIAGFARPPPTGSAALVLCGKRVNDVDVGRVRPLDKRTGGVCTICLNTQRDSFYLHQLCRENFFLLTDEDSMPRVSIYRHGEDISVVTDATDERDFLDSFAVAFTDLVTKSNGNGKASLRATLKAQNDIVAKLRGYKSDVQERRVLSAGRWPHPSEAPMVEADEEAADEEAVVS